MQNKVKLILDSGYFFTDGKREKIKIQLSDIVYLEAQGNYVSVVLKNTKHLIYQSLTNFENILPKPIFIRVHKSYMVSMTCIQKITAQQITMDRFPEPVQIPIGLGYKQSFMEMIDSFTFQASPV